MYIREKIESNLKNAIKLGVEAAIASGDFELEALPEIQLEIPREKEHGDYSTNIAMQLPRLTKKAPRYIAESIQKHIKTEGIGVEAVELAGPGFMNFKLDPSWHYEVLKEIENRGTDYGKTQKNEGKTYNLEFVSANPTGPMHMGNARGGAIGDILAEIAHWTGYVVTREFYVNDAGNQIVKFGDSLDGRFRQILGEDFPFPEDGYQGADITIHMEEYIDQEGVEASKALMALPEEERKKILVDYALEKNLKNMHRDMSRYGVDYDVWFSEKSLYENKEVEAALALLKEKDAIFEEDGAIWFKTTKFGCEKDDVLVRNNGIPTYFLGDIAYHLNKLITRKFSRSVNIWGADHHGHIARLKAAMEAVGLDPEALQVVTMQLVRLVKEGKQVRMSKRKGETISLSDLLDMVGVDAARVFFNLRSPDSHFDFDLDLALEESSDNPVFYIQYAHARICSILRQMDEERQGEADYGLLVAKEEMELMEILSDLPGVLIMAEEKMDPSQITHYAQSLASAFHSFYNACRVRIDDEDLMRARLGLIVATRQVLKNVLGILGVDAPDAM